MTDLHIDSKLRRSGMLPGSSELQRRKELRNGRRIFRSWPLLPVPAVLAGGAPRLGPTVEWPHGDPIHSADDWQDRPDEQELARDFALAPEVSLWRESIDAMRAATRSRTLKICLLASVALHLGCAVFFISMPAPESVEIAGGGAVSVMLVGEQAFDSLAAGKAEGEEVTQSVEETKAVETAEQPMEATTTRELVEPVESERAAPEPLTPSAQMPLPSEVKPVEATQPAQTTQTVSEIQNAAPTETVAPAENLAIDSSSVSETGELTQVAPVEPQPEIEVERAETPPVEPVKPPEASKPSMLTEDKLLEKKAVKPKKVEKPKTEEKKTAARKQAEAEKEAKSAPAKSRKGDAGEANANAQRGASANSDSQAHSDPGNAAVSNYPGKVAAKLRRVLKFPKSAVSGSRGETQVAFTVLSDGSATGIRIVSSSGSAVLDQAAIDAVKRASPFPPIPTEAGRKQWPFAVPVLFRR